MLRVHDVRQITIEHPAQWRASTDDGRSIYIHAKYGRLRAWAGPAESSDDQLLSTDPILKIDFGHEHEPCPLWEEVEAMTGISRLSDR